MICAKQHFTNVKDANHGTIMQSESEASAFLTAYEKQILSLRLRMTIRGSVFRGWLCA